MISIIIPFYNEAENLTSTHQEISNVVKSLSYVFEIIYIDDGSVDKGYECVAGFMNEDVPVHLIPLSRHFGQTEALQAGIDHAHGDIFIFLDADGQNDPRDIPKLVTAINRGYDVVSGWRRNRKDPFITRILPSMIANHLIAFISGVKLHDFGCSLKAYRKEVFQYVRLYSEMHRLIPIWAAKHGFSIKEVEVSHRKRMKGRSKYNLLRTPRVLLDLLVVEFMRKYLNRPMYVFGLWAFVLIFFSMGLMTFITIRKICFGGEWVSPLFFLVVMSAIIGVQFLLMGLLAEIIIRLYYQNTSERTYTIKKA